MVGGGMVGGCCGGHLLGVALWLGMKMVVSEIHLLGGVGGWGVLAVAFKNNMFCPPRPDTTGARH